MKGITIAIVEDELIVANDLADKLQQLGYTVIPPCVSYGTAIEMLETEDPDLIVLDIQLAGKKDGIDLAWAIRERYNIPFIFLTSNADQSTIDRVKELNPPAYLVKPYKKQDLFTAIELAVHQQQQQHAQLQSTYDRIARESLFVRSNNLYYRIPFAEITYLKADSPYVEIHNTAGRTFLHRNSISQLLTQLPEKLVAQVHRSYFVNPDHITAISHDFVIIGTHEVPIGRKYRQLLLDRVK